MSHYPSPPGHDTYAYGDYPSPYSHAPPTDALSPYETTSAASPQQPQPSIPAPRAKRNPCLVHVDLAQATEEELGSCLEQLTRALVGRLDACETLHEQMTGVMKRHNDKLLLRRGVKPLPPPASSPAPVSTHNRRHVSTSHAPPRTGTVKLLLVSCGAGYTQQQALFRYMLSLGGRPEGTFLTTHQGVDKTEFPEPTVANIAQGLRWLLHGLQPGQTAVFHYCGHVDDDGLLPAEGASRSVEVRQLLAEAMLSVPLGSRLVTIIDAGEMGTPIELPFSVVAHHAPAGFEMTTGDEEEESGHVLLLSTYCEVPSTKGLGVLTAALLGILSQDPRPSNRVLISTMLTQFERKLGSRSMIPLLSANRPFQPDGEADLFL